MITKAIYSILSGDVDLGTLVSTRIYTGFLPEGIGEDGAIVYGIATVFNDTLDRVTGEGRGQIEIRCYARAYIDAETIADQVRKVLQNYTTGTVDSTYIGGIVNLAVSSEDYDEDVELYSFIVDAEVIFREVS